MSIVSNNIKYLRRLNGLTQEQFARKIGIKRSLLGAYEEARANPNLTNLKNMASSFSVSVDNLLKNDLRKLRDIPNLGLPLTPDPFSSPTPPTQTSTTTPQPLANVISKSPAPRPSLRLLARPITLKPVHQPQFQHPVSVTTAVNPPAIQPLRFNNHYEESAGNNKSSQEEIKLPQQVIQWVTNEQFNDYSRNHQITSYLGQLPTFRVPTLPSGHYRAFETGEDFTFAGALAIGTFVKNWYEIKDTLYYVFLIKGIGVITRRAYNQVKTKGILLLTSDNSNIPSIEVLIKDVAEVWEIKSYIHAIIPAPTPSTEQLVKLLDQLRDELNRTELSARLFK